MMTCRILFLIFLLAQVTTPLASASLSRGLVGHWKFDGISGQQVEDSSGGRNHGSHGNNGVISNEVPPVKFKNTGSLLLDGATDFVDVSNTTAFQIKTKMSVSGWFKTSFSGARQMIIQKGDDVIGFEWVCEVFTGGLLSVHFEVGSSGATVLSKNSELVVSDGQWHHFAALFNTNPAEEDVLLYLDGAIQTRIGFDARNTFDYGTNVAKTVIGARSVDSAPALFFNGNIDDIRIYNRFLTEAEIATLASGNDVSAVDERELGPQFDQGKAVVGKVFWDFNGDGRQDA